MKAIVQDRYGSSERLACRDVAQPVPGDNDVLVRVHAASVNARDWHIMRGDPYLARLAAPATFGLRGPKQPIRGTDFAGTVVAVGRRVSGLSVGDEVFGEADAAFAEFVCAASGVVARKPANLTFEEAAALPLAANTALQGVRDAARVQAGQRVVINGASGGVGPFAVQLAKSYGAEVTAVCSTRNVDLVGTLGADRVVDYTRKDFTRDAGRYDVVFDLVGNRSLADLRRAATPRGTIVLSGGGVSTGGSWFGPMGLILKGTLAARFVSQRVVRLEAVPSRENLVTLCKLAEAGQLTPVIDRRFDLADGAEAIRYLEVEHARAKVVINVT